MTGASYPGQVPPGVYGVEPPPSVTPPPPPGGGSSSSSAQIPIPVWSIFLANSDDLSLIADISLECRSKSLVLALNRPGNFNWTMPMSTQWKDYLNPVEHCIILYKYDQPVWSGPIWTKAESFANRNIQLSAVGWFQLIHKRFITDANRPYSNQNEGSIAFDLLNYANAQHATWVTPGTNTSTGSRTRTYNRWQNIGEEIYNLTQIESGFDFTIHPIDRTMNIKNWDQYNDLTDLKFAFDFGPDNLLEVTRETNADDLANQMYVVGPNSTATDFNSSSITQFNLHQNVVNINEISDNNILAAIMEAELAVNQYPRVTINFDPKAEGTQENIPKFHTEYNIGDKIYLTARQSDYRGAHPDDPPFFGADILNQAIRLFGLTVNIDDNGNEKINSIQTTAQTG